MRNITISKERINMQKKNLLLAIIIFFLTYASVVFASPSVYPTGVTIYNPEKCWNGYTIFPAAGQQGAVLIDMNGNVVKFWKGLRGEPGPNRLLPGGIAMGATAQEKGTQNYTDLVKVDWDGNILWRFNKIEKIKGKDGQPDFWSARQHHDYQLEGNPVGYYAPGMEYKTSGKVLLLSHRDVKNDNVSDKAILEDDRIVEIDKDGKIIWEWLASDHFDEFGFSKSTKQSIQKDPNILNNGKGDWAHINAASYLGPNKWYDAGDKRFNPDNILADGRELNTTFIIDKKSGKIVWKLGPYYRGTPELEKIGWIIGQHNAHMIPQGLPGAGNVMIFDNGGNAGYDTPNGSSTKTGLDNVCRDYSRVVEINPVTLELIWEFDASKLGYFIGWEKYNFFSPYISSAQRLPNGNTLITEGSTGRFIEVTRDYEIVWEYVSPFFVDAPGPTDKKLWNMVFRAYRAPYDYVPQLKKPTEKAIVPPKNAEFHVPGSTPVTYDNAETSLKMNGTPLDSTNVDAPTEEEEEDEDEMPEEGFKSY